jgi:hypothetical protein
MRFVRPRLTDWHNLLLPQAETDFAIPFLDEDIPLYLDPFLLWRSPSQQDQALHTVLINSFNHLGYVAKHGRKSDAIDLLVALSECDEVGLGMSRTREGRRIGKHTAQNIIALFYDIPEYSKGGFTHFEEIQFFVEHISKDRISDFACSFLKSFLIDYTIQQCQSAGVPMAKVRLDVYSYRKNRLLPEKVSLPVNPGDGKPIILVPKRWLRFSQWINFDEYFADACPQDATPEARAAERVKVLTYNREHYGAVFEYVAKKEREAEDCTNDPLFAQIPVSSAKAALKAILRLPLSSGAGDPNDRKYEQEMARLLASAFYPQLDFAAAQDRTDSGVLIRDLIFYNNRSHPFLEELVRKYDCRQIVMEMKNVKQIDGKHINQVNRYMTEQFGRFGVLLTRRPLPARMFKNTIDLWSAQRRCILALTDQELELIVNLFESKQRDPIDVLQKKYVEFTRACPG